MLILNFLVNHALSFSRSRITTKKWNKCNESLYNKRVFSTDTCQIELTMLGCLNSDVWIVTAILPSKTNRVTRKVGCVSWVAGYFRVVVPRSGARESKSGSSTRKWGEENTFSQSLRFDRSFYRIVISIYCTLELLDEREIDREGERKIDCTCFFFYTRIVSATNVWWFDVCGPCSS